VEVLVRDDPRILDAIKHLPPVPGSGPLLTYLGPSDTGEPIVVARYPTKGGPGVPYRFVNGAWERFSA
jgi:hypothetical protein